jgi:2-keto-4-pentenoate hydratase
MSVGMPRSAKQEALADLLADARRNGSQLSSLPDEFVPDSAADAYAVNQLVAERLGWEPLGWKIAGTTDAVRGKLRLDGPIYGRTFRRFACTSPVLFKAAELLDPLVECEFFVTLSRDLPPRPEPWTFSEVIDAIGDVHPALKSRNAVIREPRCRRGLPSSPTAAPQDVTSSARGSRTGATALQPSVFGSKWMARCVAEVWAPT